MVVIAFNGAALLERCLASLQRQTLREGVETLVVGNGEAGQGGDLERRFPDVRWLRAPRGSNVPRMRSFGIARSRGEVVAFLEDDCVAAETWCAALLAAHRGPHAAVGGAVEPGGYTKALDWAVYFCEYGRFMRPLPKGEARALPGTNASYKREALAELANKGGRGVKYEPPVPDPSEGFYEVFAHEALRRAGRLLKADAAPVVWNVNSWTAGRALKTRFHHGRGFAGMRVAGRPMLGRIAYLGIAVVLPAVQTGRVAREAISRRRHVRRLARALHWTLMLSVSWSLGELVGYCLGPGGSLQRWR